VLGDVDVDVGWLQLLEAEAQTALFLVVLRITAGRVEGRQIVRAVILENDKEKRRLRLGLKQLQPTHIDVYIAEHKKASR